MLAEVENVGTSGTKGKQKKNKSSIEGTAIKKTT